MKRNSLTQIWNKILHKYKKFISDYKSEMLIVIEVAFIEPPLLVWREISLVIAPQIAESNFRTNIK